MTAGRIQPPAARSAWLRMGAVALAVLALDQVTKALVRGSVARGEVVEVGLGIEIVNVRNPGIAFGLLPDGGPILLVVAVLTLAVLLGWFATAPARGGLWLAVGLLVGGALGNLTDRLREGEVTDFFDPPLWPAFNVADVAITLGVLAVVVIAFTAAEAKEP